MSDPNEWVGLGFVATIENAPGEIMASIEGIESVAAQIVWAMDAQKPELMEAYLAGVMRAGLVPVGWGWCDAVDRAGARAEGLAHARIAASLGLEHYIANMEEPYDAHADINSSRFHMPDAYVEAFREILPDIHFAVTTTPRWASNHQALINAGAVMMPQSFPLAAEGGYSVAHVTQFCMDWGWDVRYLRPLCQVYEGPTGVPPAGPFLEESEYYGVGLVPYILEQALGGEGRELLSALVPAITRQPVERPEEPDMPVIGKQNGIEATYNRFKALDPEGCNPAFDPKRPFDLPLDQMKAYDKWCRTMTILVSDHDAAAV